ncbi:MAG: hypothetical protein JWN00_6078 [Actinomycetia bacterium]|nr:hypothetical protein [Actinomycetes bacterium]
MVRYRVPAAGLAAAISVAACSPGHATTGSSGPASTSAGASAGGELSSCGTRLALPVPASARGLRLSIAGVRRVAAQMPPQATVLLSSNRDVKVVLPGRTHIQVLLIRDGVVVDRFGYPNPRAERSPSGEGGIGRVVDVAPARPYVITVDGGSECGGARWADVWPHSAAYSLVAVMPAPQTLPVESPGSGSQTLLTGARRLSG